MKSGGFTAAISAFLLVVTAPSADGQMEIVTGILFVYAIQTGFNLGALLGSNAGGNFN